MASGAGRIKQGAFIGTGSALDVIVIGFKPQKVELYNESGLAEAVWTESMANGEMLKRVTGGTLSKVTTTGVTPLATGFRLGADADMNVATEKVHYTAHE